MSSPRILFVVDAGPLVGGGHVMRALTLAQALQAQGATCSFSGPPAMTSILDAYAPDMARIDAADLAQDSTSASFDALVFDHYGLGEGDHRALARGRPVLVVDDLADRALGADVVVDAGPARRATDYLGLTPDDARLLLGPGFAAVRPEFAALREPALAWRGEPVQRILIAMGLTDVDGITARVVERVRPRLNDTGIDIVLGAETPSYSGLLKIARLTAEADIGIGAPGSSTWERCVLGLPSVLVVLAENQRPAARAMAELGAALVVDVADADFETAFDRALMKLLRDAEARREMAARSAGVCDGLGAGRTAEIFLKLIAARG
jgi:UDP-2,4-diacetamido-2,4,6-trideoxy-beta-L-altropyranose hydrolase